MTSIRHKNFIQQDGLIEVTDHLGNVMITASDKKFAIKSSDDTIRSYRPELPSTYDYYPFGMLMPGRYTHDTSVQCATVNHTIYIPIVSSSFDLPGAMFPATFGAGMSLRIINNSADLEITSAGIANSGVELSMQHVGLHENNRLTFKVAQIDEGVQFTAQLFEYNIDDTVLLDDALLDRDAEVILDYTPSGSGTLRIIVSARVGSPGTVTLRDFNTSITGYQTQQVTKTICSEGEDKYRFGFNGMEKDNEMKGIGNSLDFGARIYDSRLGRWLSLDPLAAKYPHLNPYNFVENNPIIFMDHGGLDASWRIVGNTIYISALCIVGKDFPQDQINKIKKQIENTWVNNKNFTFVNSGNVYNIKFEAKFTQNYGDLESVLFGNFLNYQNSTTYRDNVSYGKFATFSKNTDAGSHEFGHLLGIADRYWDKYTRKFKSNGSPVGNGKQESDWDINSIPFKNAAIDDLMAHENGKVQKDEIAGIGNFILDLAAKTNTKSGAYHAYGKDLAPMEPGMLIEAPPMAFYDKGTTQRSPSNNTSKKSNSSSGGCLCGHCGEEGMTRNDKKEAKSIKSLKVVK